MSSIIATKSVCGAHTRYASLTPPPHLEVVIPDRSVHFSETRLVKPGLKQHVPLWALTYKLLSLNGPLYLDTMSSTLLPPRAIISNVAHAKFAGHPLTSQTKEPLILTTHSEVVR